MALTEKEKSARLRLIQLAAAHVLRLHADDKTPFKAGEVFPDQLRPRETSTSDYTWRQQLAWTWARANFLDGVVTGHGLHKVTLYSVTDLGVQALMRIASEPALAAFYISQKRTSAVTMGYTDPDMFRPFELRAEQLDDQTPEDDHEEPEAAPEDGGGESLPEAEDGEVWSEDTGDAPAPVTSAEAAQLGVFFERSIAVLENMNTKLARFDTRMATMESEVQAQSTLVLELASKFEGAASRDDVAEAAANLIAMTVRERDTDRAALTREMANLANHTRTICSALGDSVKFLDNHIVSGVSALGRAVADDVGKLHAALDTLAMAKPATSRPADVDLSPLIVILSRIESGLGAVETKLSAATAAEPSTDVGALDKRLGEVSQEITGFRAQIKELEDVYAAASSARQEASELYTDRMDRIAETATAVLEGAKYIAGSLIELSLKVARDGGVTANEAEKAVHAAVTTFSASQDAIKNRTTALGAGLIHMLNQPPDALVLRPADQDVHITPNVRIVPTDLATSLKLGGAK